MNRGYAGFYNGYYLRSSYEYAYAKYLDYYLISWSYEDKVFDLGYKIYRPDFFFYDNNGNLVKIVEVKSREQKAKDNALKALNTIEEKYNIICELVSYEELIKMYRVLPFSLTSILTEWIQSNETTINKAAYGKLNGHYNLKHTDETRRKIGEHTKKLWATDSIAKRKMIEGLKKSGLAQKGKFKKPREKRKCSVCGEEFDVIQSSSQSCAGNSAIKIATSAYIEKREVVHINIKNYINQWSIQNKDLELKTSYNKIKPAINPLLENIQKQFGVKDLRVISKAVFGKDCGRKELLKYMKRVCNENVC